MQTLCKVTWNLRGAMLSVSAGWSDLMSGRNAVSAVIANMQELDGSILECVNPEQVVFSSCPQSSSIDLCLCNNTAWKGRFRTRKQSLQRYLEKKAKRLQTKKIRYELRKINADKRPRWMRQIVRPLQRFKCCRDSPQIMIWFVVQNKGPVCQERASWRILKETEGRGKMLVVFICWHHRQQERWKKENEENNIREFSSGRVSEMAYVKIWGILIFVCVHRLISTIQMLLYNRGSSDGPRDASRDCDSSSKTKEILIIRQWTNKWGQINLPNLHWFWQLRFAQASLEFFWNFHGHNLLFIMWWVGFLLMRESGVPGFSGNASARSETCVLWLVLLSAHTDKSGPQIAHHCGYCLAGWSICRLWLF